MRTHVSILLFSVMLCASSAMAAVTFDWAVIGDINNDADDTGYGSVGYQYSIATTEVTNAQYIEFLNAVAKTDTHGLYDSAMGGQYGGISQSGTSGNFTYNFKNNDANWANRPVGSISWYDALRFINWLNNGQLTGAQDATTTEYGVYDMSLQSTNPENIVRLAGADYWLPSEDEWYKAAYYDPDTEEYYNYSTGSNTQPDNYTPNSDTGNSANYYGSGYALGSPYYSTEVGAYDESVSPYGTYDQTGNAWEWNEALIGSYRGLRGGSYWADSNYLSSSSRYYHALGPDGGGYGFSAGIRVASSYTGSPAVPEPASIGLVLFSVSGLSIMKRRRI